MRKFIFITITSILLTNISLTYARDGVKLDGLYKSLGIGIGYYRYQEYDTAANDAFVMKMDMYLLNIAGNIGYITNGFKIDLAVDANISFGKYTGAILDVSNPDRNGTPVTSIDANSFYHATLKTGYNILELFNIDSMSLYLQSGVNYYFNRNDAVTFERLQGYVSIPFQLEGEIVLKQSLALNFMGGFNWFLFGHHFTNGIRGHLSGNINVTQKQGLGANGYIGITWLDDNNNANSIRMTYEYWSVGDSVRVPLTDLQSNITKGFFEPKNKTHIIMLQYIWGF
ncbi:hypothetical protein LS73_001900 [Helicobacter muridarum]|uniref:Outer membrane protein n=1 Tax=Helicobacter muridarum TaxID=216 RepID=A0A099TVY2_9HELI|nr:hypothetical protein [Helicobacter muridarum]TLE01446.1 hypothetical protein LS73_001900 [Helicobacter muridarum]STQ85388.1 Uncharacterised protein [Helicobacter muridarum]